MPIINDKQYKCDCCGYKFNLVRNEDWNSERAEEEYKNYFPDSSIENRYIVCDDCFELMKPK